MKDIIFTKKMQLHELITLAICFAIAFLLNVYAIIAYEGKAIETITSIGYVLVFTLALYAAWTAIRILWHILRRIISKKQK